MLSARRLGKLRIDLFEHSEAQEFGLAIEARNVVDCFDGICIASLREEITWRLGDLESEDTNETERYGNGSQGDHEVAPTDV